MSRKGGYQTVLVSACFRRSPMGECDTYLEFYMSKDSIVAAELGVGQPCTARVQKDHPCDNLEGGSAPQKKKKHADEFHHLGWSPKRPRPFPLENSKQCILKLLLLLSCTVLFIFNIAGLQ